MKNYLFMAPSLSSGGAERVMANIASDLKNFDIKASIIIFSHKEKEYSVDQSVDIYVLNDYVPVHKGIRGKLEKFQYLIYLFKKINPDIVIPFLSGASEYAFIASKFVHAKFVSTIRNNPKVWPESFRLRIHNYLLCMFANRCFFQNNEQMSFFPKFVQKKAFVLPNPINQKAFEAGEKYKNKDGKITRIVSVGRLNAQKNFPLLIQAIKEIHKIYPKISLDIWGEGECREELFDLIKKDNLDGIVTLKGYSSNIYKELLEYDAFVLSSDYEGMPNALMEAMAIGLPCISTDCPTGPRDLIDHGQNGMLVSVGDVDGMMQALLYMIEKPEDAIKMGNNGRKKALQVYNIESIVKKLISYLE